MFLYQFYYMGSIKDKKKLRIAWPSYFHEKFLVHSENKKP